MNVEKNVLKNKREIVNQKIKNRTYLDTIEKRKLISLNLTNRSQPILAYLIEKYIYFFNSKLLNSKGEFYQSYDDIALGVISNLSYHLIKKSLDELTEKGYITRVLKIPEGAKTNIPKYHFVLNFDKLNDILISTKEFNLPTHKKYEIQQNIKYAHSADDKSTETIEDNTATTEHTEPDAEIKTASDDDIPTKENIKPKNGHEEVDKEITNPTKEDNNQLTEEEIMKINEEFREKVREEDFNEMTKLFMKYKDLEGVAPVLKDTMLSFDTINYLFSNDYKEGVDKRLDDKKATLNILYDIRIKPLIDK